MQAQEQAQEQRRKELQARLMQKLGAEEHPRGALAARLEQQAQLEQQVQAQEQRRKELQARLMQQLQAEEHRRRLCCRGWGYSERLRSTAGMLCLRGWGNSDRLKSTAATDPPPDAASKLSQSKRPNGCETWCRFVPRGIASNQTSWTIITGA